MTLDEQIENLQGKMTYGDKPLEAALASLRELKAMKAEADANRKDAERYRWLLTHSYKTHDGNVIEFGPGWEQTRPEILDSAIKEAMRYPVEIDAAREGK